jgi:hypothetical protein
MFFMREAARPGPRRRFGILTEEKRKREPDDGTAA